MSRQQLFVLLADNPARYTGFQNISRTKFYLKLRIGAEFLKKTGVLV
jgi:hypothetical protein